MINLIKESRVARPFCVVYTDYSYISHETDHDCIHMEQRAIGHRSQIDNARRVQKRVNLIN